MQMHLAAEIRRKRGENVIEILSICLSHSSVNLAALYFVFLV